MTAVRRVSSCITATTTPAQVWGSTTPSHPVDTLKDGVVALDRDGPMADERVAWRALVGELQERGAEKDARIAALEAEIRESRRLVRAMMALGQLDLDCSAVALHGLDDDEEGLEEPIIDLPLLESQRLFPRAGSGFER